MRQNSFTLSSVLLAAIALLCPALQLAQTVQSTGTGTKASYGTVPLRFEANEGQTNPEVDFLSRGHGYSVFLTSKGMVLSFHPIGEAEARMPEPATVDPSFRANMRQRWLDRQRHGNAIAIDLVGANPKPLPKGELPLATRVNYFVGNDPKKWHRNIPTYQQIRYTDVYPGVDLVYYGKNHQLEYDFSLRPGADPSRIQFAVRGADAVRLDSNGNLLLTKADSTLLFQVPQVFEESSGHRQSIPGSYVMRDATHVGFTVAKHDSTKRLVIDPVLVYSTFLGGSNDDYTSGIAVDAAGDAYVAGLTDSSDFPLTPNGSPSPVYFLLFLAKLDAAGQNLLFVDFFGGSSGNDDVTSIALDSSGNAFVTGATGSSDFPITANAFQTARASSGINGSDAYLTEFSADGATLLYSSFLGGSNSQYAYSVAVDPAGEAVVGGVTESTDFPIRNGYQTSVAQDQFGDWGEYGFLTKFTAPLGNSVVYSTYLGGNNLDPTSPPVGSFPISNIIAVATDIDGNAFVTGQTNTTNFPLTPGALLTSYQGRGLTSGFVSKLSTSGSIGYSTYLPLRYGVMDSIAVDATGAAYVTGGSILANSFPVTNTSICNPSVGCNGAIVAKIDPTGSSFVYSTYLDSGNITIAEAIQVDAQGDAFILGGGQQFNLVNPIQQFGGSRDVIIAEIDPSATTVLMATALGGQGAEGEVGMALGSDGSLYVTGLTESLDFPVSQPTIQSSWGGNTDAFITKIDLNTDAPAVSMGPWSLDFGPQYVGTTSASQTSVLRNMGSAPLIISDQNTSGDFAESDDCAGTVAAASFCTLTFTFTPTATGDRTGTFTISDSAQGSPHTLSLSGSGTDTRVSVSPASLTFPDTTIGSASPAQTVTLSNTGSVAVTVSAVPLSGDFSIVSDTCTGSTVQPNGTCTVQVDFTPQSSDQLTGTLQFQDSAANSPQLVTLSGTGLIADVTISPSSLTFPDTPVGSSSAAQSVTLTNTGQFDLNVTGVQLTGDFSLVSDNCSGSTLAPNDVCTVQVDFIPTAPNPRSGTLQFQDSSASSPQLISLSGNGTDFMASPNRSSATVQPGGTAIYTLNVTSVGSSFTNSVDLSCTGLPSFAACTISPKSVVPNGSAVTVSVSTSGALRSSNHISPEPRILHLALIYAPFTLFGLLLFAPRRARRKIHTYAAVALVLALSLLTGCYGTSSSVPVGIRAGTYNFSVVASSGALRHVTTLNLIVQ